MSSETTKVVEMGNSSSHSDQSDLFSRFLHWLLPSLSGSPGHLLFLHVVKEPTTITFIGNFSPCSNALTVASPWTSIGVPFTPTMQLLFQETGRCCHGHTGNGSIRPEYEMIQPGHAARDCSENQTQKLA